MDINELKELKTQAIEKYHRATSEKDRTYWSMQAVIIKRKIEALLKK